MKRSSCRLVGIGVAAVVVMSIPVLGWPASAATSRTIQGTVTCTGGKAVTGVWVNSSGGGSRFAGWAPFAGVPSAAYFSTTVSTSSASTGIRLDVGCGGTTSKWWSNNSTSTMTVSSSRVINTRCAEASGSRATRCGLPPKGRSVATNPGAAGNCTWGAQDQWRKRTGYYLATAGDAKDWNTNAGGAWVAPVPHINSIVVFEAYSSGSGAKGHVAWVTGMKAIGSGAFDVTVIEMNALHGGGGFNKYNNWTYRHVPGQMSYILASN